MLRNLFCLAVIVTLSACNGGSPDAANNIAGEGVTPPTSATNSAPVANDDVVVVPTDTSIVIDVLANDTDADGDDLSIITVNQPDNGSASIDDNGTANSRDDRIVYQPVAGFAGVDQFSYDLRDSGDGTASGSVFVNVGGTAAVSRNQAKADSTETETTAPVSVDVLDNDLSIGIATITSYSQPAHGAVSLNDGATADASDDTLIYTPDSGFTGFDSFTYILNSDSHAAVSVTVKDTPAGIIPLPVSDGVSGRVVKGSVSNAVVKLYALAATGIEDRSAPLYQTVTDDNGYWTTPLAAQGDDYLVVSSGGRYFDESNSTTNSKPIEFEDDEEFIAVLPAGETFAVTSVYSAALYQRALADTQGANFASVLAGIRGFFMAATGLDVVTTDPDDPANPDVAGSSADEVSYGMLIGGAAEALNDISSSIGLSIADYPVVVAMIDDLTDCRLDGQGVAGPVVVSLPAAPVAMPENINLNTQILRFRNNRASEYNGATLAQVNNAPCQSSGTLPDVTAPAFTQIPTLLQIGAAPAAGIAATDPRIVSFLASAQALDDRDGVIAVTDNAPAVFAVGDSAVTFTAIDISGNVTNAMQTISVNAAPTAVGLDNVSILENPALGAVVGSLTTTDTETSDTYTYSLIAGAGDTDNAAFAITGGTLRTNASFDFETQSSYSVRVQSQDQSGGSVAGSIMISILDQNEAPTSVSLSSNSVGENQAAGVSVGSFATADVDASDAHAYSLVAGAGDDDNALFLITGSTLQTLSGFDFETQTTYSIRVQSQDSGGEVTAQFFTINVIDTNDAPTAINLSGTSVDENVAIGTAVATLGTNDADAADTHSYSLVTGFGDSDNGQFSVIGDVLLTGANIDYETQASYAIRLQSQDSVGEIITQAFVITVNDLADGLTALALDSLSIDENLSAGALVGNLSSTHSDPAETFTYLLVSGPGDTNNAAFNIAGNQLVSSAVYDFETQTSYSVRIQTTDSAGDALSAPFTITVNDVNDTPVALALDSSSVSENQAIGTTVGNLTSTDQDAGDTFSYALVAGPGDTDNSQFSIVGNQLLTGAAFDFELQSGYTVRIETTDASGATFSSAFAITINNVNDIPTAVALDSASVDENLAIGSAVGNLSSTDQDTGDTFTYALVAGSGDTDNGQFSIAGNQLLTAAAFDFETQSSFAVRIETTDGGGATFSSAVAITINNVNDTPTAVALDSASVDENLAIGTTVGNLSSTDQDTGDTFTYALVAGPGDTDNGQFSIAGNQLLTGATFDFELQSSYTVRIETTDAGGATFSSAFAITINNVNDTPTAVALDSASVDENLAIGTTVGNLSSTDQDTGDTFTYALVAGAGDTDNGQFSIAGNQLLTAAAFDFETQSSFAVRIETTDGGGATFSSAFAITINNVNDFPTAVALDSASVDENLAIGTTVGNLSSTDQDTGDTFTYALVAGPGDTDNGQFSIAGSQLLTAAVFDFETQSSYTVRIETTDGGGASHTDQFTVSVNDLPETPADQDSDGLTDDEETALQGTFAGDPACPYINNADSDGDSIGDGAEVDAGGNPCATDPQQTIFYVDPTGTWPGSVTNVPADPSPSNTSVPNYVLIQSGVFNSEISPTGANCDNLHYIGSQDFAQPGVIQYNPATDRPTTTIDMQNTRFSVADGCANMVLQDVALTNGVGDGGRGGGIRAKNGAQLLLDRVRLYGNAAGDQGGGIGISNAGTVVNIRNSWIEENTVSVEKGGGGLWAGNGTTVNMYNTVVRANRALGSGGGGLYFDQGVSGLIENSWIVENVASESGGGIEVDTTLGAPASLVFDSLVVAGNYAGFYSGGIHILGDGTSSSTVVIRNSQVLGNYADFNGGGVGFYDSGTNADMQNTLIVANQSSSSGAGIRVFGGGSAPLLENLTLALNRTSGPAGGGISVVTGGPQIYDSILWQNRAGDRAISAAPVAGDCYFGVGTSDYNLLEIDKIGASDIDFVNDGVQPFFSSAFYLDQGLSPAIDTGSTTSVLAGLDTLFTGPVVDGGQLDRGYHYSQMEAAPADDYRETGGAFVNQVTVSDAETGANAERLMIEPTRSGVPIGPGHIVIATLEGLNTGLAQIIPLANVDPLSDGESALLIDQGSGIYAADLHAIGIAPGVTNIPLRVFVDGTDLGVVVTIIRDN